MDNLMREARSIVDFILEAAAVPVKVRQNINDTCDDIVRCRLGNIINEHTKTYGAEAIMERINALEVKFYRHVHMSPIRKEVNHDGHTGQPIIISMGTEENKNAVSNM